MRHTIIAIALLLSACKQGSNASAASTSDDPAEATPKLTPTQQLGAKLGPYIDCLNAFSKDVYQGRHTWLDEFDAKKGPLAKQSNETLYGPLALPDPKDCKEGIAKVKAAAPKLPELEAAGDAYLAAITTLQPITVDLRNHFDQRDYKDDKLAHAIEMHPKLMDAYAAFMPADKALGDAVDKLEDKLAVDQLADLEKTEGKRLRWHHKHTLVEAKKVVAFALAVRSPFEIKDTTALQAALTEYDTAVTDLVKYYAANKAEIDQIMGYRSLESDAKNFLKDAKDMLRRVRDKQAFSSGEKMTIEANNGEAVEGHPSRVIASYNSLIDTSNWSRF